MKQNCFMILIIFFAITSYGQEVELSVGLGLPSLINRSNSSYPRIDAYNSVAPRVSMKLGVRQLKIDHRITPRMDVFIGYYSYQHTDNSSAAVSKMTSTSKNVNIEKQYITLELYPLNLSFFNKVVELSSGVEIAAMINSNITGTSRSTFTPITVYTGDDDGQLSKLRLSWNSSLSYVHQFNERWGVRVHYLFNLGITNEYSVSGSVYLKEHRLGLGMIKILGSEG